MHKAYPTTYIQFDLNNRWITYNSILAIGD